jgi:nicotinate-nucleotide pyrophosphorylase (carboxylating)
MLPHPLLLDPLLRQWLQEDWGRGDLTTMGLFSRSTLSKKGTILLKEPGVIAGLPIAARIFQLTDPAIVLNPLVAEGTTHSLRTPIATVEGPVAGILMAERVALNLVQRLSGIATATRRYAEALSGSTAKLTDTRKTTPGLRILEKYASRVGGAVNHRMGLDDAVMLKDNHIEAAGSIQKAVAQVRSAIPYPVTIEVECEALEQVQAALETCVDTIMLDNMGIEAMKEAVKLIAGKVTIEASGNITLENIRAVGEVGVDFISTSAPITRSSWLDISLDLHS